MKKIIIAAVSRNNVIGGNGKIPWHSREELSHFKETTTGYPVIMGRKTFESIGKPLKERSNLIITSNPQFFAKFEEIKCFFNLKEALFFCENNNFEKVFIAGGAQIFKEAISIADELLISRMNVEAEGDRFFPEINKDEWKVIKERKFDDFEILTYIRKKNERN